MATNFESSFELLRAAAIYGRTTNIRYRQNELQSLHAALRNDAESICAAIQNDSQSSGANAESEAEYYLAIDAVAHFYEVLDFDKALKDEYMISTGEDNPNRRVGKGALSFDQLVMHGSTLLFALWQQLLRRATVFVWR
jgi:hypothetical protein